jgi:hypothetical protein
MSDLADAIDEEGRDITVERKGADTYSEDPATYGQPIAAVPETKTIRASVQPASGSALSNKPEGVQAESKLVIWTREPLREDDVIVDGAKRYRILDFEDWQADGGYSVGYLGSLGETS